jgi:hypothetical protein
MLDIFTYAHKRPDFIELQYNSIKKYVKCNYNYTVFNNAIDNKDQYLQIKNICSKLNIKCVDIQLDPEMQTISGITNFVNNTYPNANVGTSYPIQWSFKHYVTDEKLVCILDSDMFFINEINLEQLIIDKDIVYIPQYRQNHNIQYVWNAFVLLNLHNKPQLKNLDWTPSPINNENMDVGAQTYYFLQNNNINSSFLEEDSIRYITKYDLTEIEYILNGNINYLLRYDHLMNLVSFDFIGGQQFSDAKSFPYQNDRDLKEYISKVVKNLLAYFEEKSVNFPNPCHIAFIKEVNTDYYFIVHYKSGSNYLNFSTETYNTLKTKELIKLL